ncbi:MAG TPA: adenylate/guanylate cyclase domain-containing protein [Gaiellaceae bacterium]|nr:adenylate/guanylate cyclase domain-containing protein [Gaiellaceae bacterium]
MAPSVACPRCGRGNAPGDRFCGACGAELDEPCASCGTRNPPGSSFCRACGTSLTTTPATELAAERRVVTVLFADLVGFTSRAERLDPEDVRSILSPYYGRLRQELEQYGGTVEKFIGDAVVAVFGAPVAHGDDPERGVRAALAVRDAIAELNAADPRLDLQVRIAVNTGEAIVALEGTTIEGEGMVAGDVVNTAARLQTAAPTNGILVGEETYRATHSTIAYEPVDPIDAKGKSRPVPAWVALEASAPPAERGTARTAIVGRERELAVLNGIWERVVGDSRPHLVTIFGSPGIGKTRLTTEFCDAVDRSGARVLRGRCFPYGGSSPYGAFGSQVKQMAGIFDSDTVPDAREKLEQTVAALLESDDAAEVASQLSMLVGLEAGRAAVDRPVAFFAARTLVEAMGRDRPTLLVFEDIHWAEPGLLDLLESFASRLRDVSVLLVTLARPELLTTRPSWGGGLPAYTALPLDPLGAEDALELARALLGDSAEAADRLTKTAEGNPLFLEELAASLLEGAAEADQLPTNVRGIIAARLDTLPPHERALLLHASVVGKVFWRGALAAAHGDTVDETLDGLEQRDLIRREPISRIQGDPQCVFKHMLIREVAYATLPRSVRSERHAGIASFLEEAAKDRVGEWATVLANHWRDAGNPERELRWVLAAAERGWATDALALYERALELVPAVSDDRRLEVRLASAIAHVQAGLYGAAIEELDELLPGLEGQQRFDGLSARGRAAFWSGDAEGAHRYWREARNVAETLGDEDLQIVTLALLSTAAAMDGSIDEAIEMNERALSLWHPGARPREFAEANLWSSIQFYWRGDYARAAAPARRGTELSEEAAYVEGMISGPAHLGIALAGLGRHEEALRALEQAVTQGATFEVEPRFTSRATAMWAGVLRELYELEDARVLNERAIALGEEARFPGSQVSGKIDLLVIDVLSRELGSAESAWPSLWEAAVQTKGWHQWLWMTRLLHAKAELALAAGRAEDAAAAAREAIAEAGRYPRVKYVQASRLALGRALHALGRTEDGVAELRLALDGAQQLSHPPAIWNTAAALARARADSGDDDGAIEAAELARRTLDDFAAALSETRRERFFASPYLQASIDIPG